jgi:hypothetical protein
LTTVAAVQAEGRGLDTIATATLERYIAAASDAIAQFLGRTLHLGAATEYLQGARGAIRLVLGRTPIVGAVSTVTVLDLGTAVTNDGTDFVIESAEAGLLQRDRGWPSSDLGGLGAAFEPVVGVARLRYTVTYSGGYVLPGTAWTTATLYAAGQKVKPTAASNGNVFEASAMGTTGTPEPTWPSAVGATVVDGGVTWTNRGPRTLPYPIEQGCIDTVAGLWKLRGGGRLLASESVGGASRSYFSGTGEGVGGGALSPSVAGMLKPYARILVV